MKFHKFNKHQKHQIVFSFSFIAICAVSIFAPYYTNHATVFATIINVFTVWEV